MAETPKFVDDDGPVTVTVRTPEGDTRTLRSSSGSVALITVMPDQGVWVRGQGNNATFYPMSQVLKIDMRARAGRTPNIEDQQLD